MNFLKRRMFQEGGASNTNPFFYVNQQGETKYLDQNKLLPILRQTNITALEALIQNPDVAYSPATQEVFRQVVGERKATFSSVNPSLFQFGEFLPDNLTGLSALRDIGGFGLDFASQIGEGVYNLGRGMLSGFGERSVDDTAFAPRDIFPSERFPNVPDTITGRPGTDEGFMSGFDESGILRRGYTNPQLATILDRALGEVQDFTPAIEEITDTTKPVKDTVPSFDFRDDDQRSKVESAEMFREQQRRERLEREAEQRAADASPILSDTLGTIDPDDAAARKSAFLESVIGMDEFGEPIPGFDERTGFTEDGLAIAKAIDDLTPIENKVDIDRTEADSLMDIENKFSPTFEPPEASIDKVDTTITAEMIKDSEERDKRKPKEFSDKTKGQFREVFGSDRFLDFIRNVGGELVRTGQLGEGLASGAAKAAEERATRDLLAEQEAKKFEREKQLLLTKQLLEGSEGLNASELNTLMKNVDELSENVMNYEGTEASIAIMNDAIALFDEAIERGVPVTGLPGRIMRFKDEAAAFLGIDNPNVSDATKIQNYIEQVKQRSIREILNESGRTISNLDREIVDNVFGGLDLTGDPKEIRKKLDNARANLIKNNRDKQRKITSDYTTLQDPEFKGKGIAAIKPYEDLILKIIGLDPSAVTRAAAQSADVDIAEITL